jgi:hypothetical protein
MFHCNAKDDFFDRLAKSDTFATADMKGKVQRVSKENEKGTGKTTVSSIIFASSSHLVLRVALQSIICNSNISNAVRMLFSKDYQRLKHMQLLI